MIGFETISDALKYVNSEAERTPLTARIVGVETINVLEGFPSFLKRTPEYLFLLGVSNELCGMACEYAKMFYEAAIRFGRAHELLEKTLNQFGSMMSEERIIYGRICKDDYSNWWYYTNSAFFSGTSDYYSFNIPLLDSIERESLARRSIAEFTLFLGIEGIPDSKWVVATLMKGACYEGLGEWANALECYGLIANNPKIPLDSRKEALRRSYLLKYTD